jgi:hypothetical protein
MNFLSTTFDVDVAPLVSAFGQRLHEAYMPVTPFQFEQYARSLVIAP